MKNNIPLINAVLIGTILASVFILLLTIIGELYGPLKSLLKDAHHHHWIGKGVWAVILFFATTIISYPIYKKKASENTHIFILPIITAYVLAGVSLILIAFFIYEFAIH